VIVSYPESEVSRGIVTGMREFLPEGALAAAEAGSKPVRTGGLLRFFKRQPAPRPAGVE
jgi:hypothetical protein